MARKKPDIIVPDLTDRFVIVTEVIEVSGGINL